MQINTLCKIRRGHDGDCAVWIEDTLGKVVVYCV